MKILLHSCCGPCTIYPLKQLSASYTSVDILFFNPNIHPFREYNQRLASLKEYIESKNITLHVPSDYDLKMFFRLIAFNEETRCPICYKMRLTFAFEFAKANGFDAITTTLLYSKFQQHSIIQTIAQELSKEFQILFIYEDYRVGWQYGVEKSIKTEMYRQKYCGCIYSEQERFDNKYKKKLQKMVISNS